jgi:hypothetical protein
MGTALDNFPNFFLIFGPNTATGHSSIILASENMVNYSLNFIHPIMSGEISTYEVRRSAVDKWTSTIQSQLKNSVFASGCSSGMYRGAQLEALSEGRPTRLGHTSRASAPFA